MSEPRPVPGCESAAESAAKSAAKSPAEPAAEPLLSVAMIATDEEDRLPAALDSVAWADEVVVIDGGSRDRTREIARARGARVEVAEWEGYAPQRRRALERVHGRWVLVLDADEVVTPELAAEIRELLAGRPAAAGYEIDFHTRYLGHWFGRGGWHRDRHLRLVRRDAVRVSDARVHEGLAVWGTVGRLRHPILHASYRDVGHHMEKVRRYAALKAKEMDAAGRRTSLAGAALHAGWRFASGYLLQGRFLDGWAGLVHELLAAHATLLAYLELWERGRSVPGKPPGGEASGP